MKISTKLISASAVALMALSQAAVVNAAGGDETPAPKAENTKGHINLQANPDEDHPGDDNNDNGDDNNNDTGQKGPFTLDVVPNYEFGIHMIESGQQTYNALFVKDGKGLDDKGAATELDKATRLANPVVQVTDLREKNTGWNVTSQITDFKTADGKVLKGAKLTLPKGTPTLQGTPGEGIDPTTFAPEASGITLGSDAQIFFKAEANKGTGTWADNMFDNKDANTLATTLLVPAGNSAGDYTADITWTLSDTIGA